ncbi:MAG: chromosome segregation protein SMC [Thaumarchaeota archaeon]|nr:chromosome segregation protein SMC [Nitrososphaerota archaeon]
METRGFKSLGSKLISIPVERGLVALTGPNGSGKSNILDAILFCLGENSPKTLRVPNLGALIYDGSVEEQKPSSAKVTLQFDNADRRVPVDTDTLSISRELKQTGESLYSLNGRHIQRNNLSELLEQALITSRGLNIVLQGMITRISELVPDEKRKLIEQMVGVAQFDEKKDLALKQLDEADRKLEVAMAKIGEIRDRVQQLEEERNDQLRVRQLEEQVGWHRAVSISSKLARVRAIIDQRKLVVADSGTRLQQLQSRLSEVRAATESMENDRSLLIKNAMDSGAAKVELELGKLNNEINSLKRDRTEAVEYVDKIRQIIPTLEQMEANQAARIGQLETQVSSLQQKLAAEEVLKSDLVLDQNQLTLERQQFEKEIESSRKKLSSLRKSKDFQDQKLQFSKEKYNQLTSELKADREKKLAIQDKIRFFEEGLSTAKKNILELENLLDSQRNELSDLRSSKSKIDRLSKRVEAQLGIALLILEKAQEAVRDYDSEVSALENVAGEEMAISKLDQLGMSSALEGYYGPLRSLISYDSQFAQAVAAIGKEWMDAIIVRDMTSLLRVMEAAKKLKIGRMTAIPLKEVGEIEPLGQGGRPGMISFMTEIVSTEPRLRSVVNFVFGDSVLVDSPKEAFVLARRGFRAVTLQGDIFEPDVLAYQTGYSKKYLQVATLLAQQKSYDGIKYVLASLHKLIDKRKAAITKLHSRALEVGGGEHQHDMEISKIETRLETTKQFVSRYAGDIKTLVERLRQTESQIERFSLETGKMEKRTLAIQLGSQKLASLISAFDLSTFDDKIGELNRRRNELDSKMDLVASETREITSEMTRVKGELENNQRPSLERLRQNRAESEIRYQEKSQLLLDTGPKLQGLESSLAALREREAETLDRAAKYQPMLDSLDVKLKSLRVEEEALRKSISSADKEHFQANTDLTRLLDSERSLVGDLGIFGYPDPIETFEGADEILRELQSEFDTLRNNVNFNADKNYKEIFENYKYSSVRKNELEKERNAIIIFIETIDSEKRKVFMDAFERIDRELRVIFTKITNGNAWLEIEKPDSIFDSGVFLMAQFPGKLPRDSSSVSGGEKTMSALSFILAIQAVFPSPFYVFDEVDAHLDSVYSGNLAAILAERCANSQVLIVSLKDTVVSKATSVIGVYMSQGSSKVVRYRSGMEVEVRAE